MSIYICRRFVETDYAPPLPLPWQELISPSITNPDFFISIQLNL